MHGRNESYGFDSLQKMFFYFVKCIFQTPETRLKSVFGQWYFMILAIFTPQIASRKKYVANAIASTYYGFLAFVNANYTGVSWELFELMYIFAKN